MAISVSSAEQGKKAGEIAYDILIEGVRPSSFEFESTMIGDEHINLARAEMLGLKREVIPSVVLINSEVVESFPWEDEE